MAINLSANTKTTGPVSQEVFDPNIGFKSGLEGLARGIGQAGQAAGNLAQKIHTKNDNVSKELAATNYSVAVTEMNSVYATYDKVISDESASSEQIADATAAYSKFQGELTYDKIDSNQDANESYYKSYVQRLTATRNALELDRETKAASVRQRKALDSKVNSISNYTSVLTAAVPDSSFVTNEMDSIIKSHSEGEIINDLNDRDFVDKILYASFDETLTTSISRFSELPSEKAESELTVIREKLLSVEDLNTPRSKKAFDSALTKIDSALSALGKAGDAKRKAVNVSHDNSTVQKAETFIQRLDSTRDSLTGAPQPTSLSSEGIESVVLPLSSDAPAAAIKSQDKSIGNLMILSVNDDGITNVAAAALAQIKGTPFTGLSAETYQQTDSNGVLRWDKSALVDNPDVLSLQAKLVDEEEALIKEGIEEGDFSVLARIDKGFAENWKKLQSSTDVNERAGFWRALQTKTDLLRKDPDFKEFFTGVKSFAIMPEDNGVAFSSMQKDQKLSYLTQMAQLNGAGIYQVVESLQNSASNSDKVTGTLMKLHLDNLAEQALESRDTGSSIYSGTPVKDTDDEGKVSYTNASAVSSMYDAVTERGVRTPLGYHILAANRKNDYALADMLKKIEMGQIASAVGTLTSVTADTVYENLLSQQKPYTDSLGYKVLSSNGVVISIPTLDPSNTKQAYIKKNLDPSESPEVYTSELKNVLINALTEQEVATTPFLKKLAVVRADKDGLKTEALRSSIAEKTYSVSDENINYVRGLFEKTVAGDLPNIDFSQTITIGGVEHYMPMVYVGSNKYEPLKTGSGDRFVFPVNAVHDKVHARLKAPASEFGSVMPSVSGYTGRF